MSPITATQPSFTLYLLGDAGRMPEGTSQSLFDTLKRILCQASPHSALIFLGDNLYPRGMDEAFSMHRATQEAILKAQIALYSQYPGKVVWLAGNHDWQYGGPNGWQARLRQERFVEGLSARGNIFLPDSGCPGPVVLRLSPGLALIVLDTQWWLHRYDRPLTLCGYQKAHDFLKAFVDTLQALRHMTLVVAAHHPLFTRGPHGGVYPWQAHFFPLLEHFRWGWIPMPLLGTAYVLLRRAGYVQDLTHRHYRYMRDSLYAALRRHGRAMYVNGHDHSLQVIHRHSTWFITSGAGSSTSHVVKGRDLMAAAARIGFIQLDFYPRQILCTLYTFHVREGCQRMTIPIKEKSAS
ncbi:MAG: metallophosphoesterase [Flavobacteriales bacterium]|nr:metallophosphoesterase [Flavobacteriales bacterium]MCX7767819.1 metallophosphoesterase [Flavobacteriales bacterium]MDW8409780.1 metallophosphoesterase [Flavobacteriales bacterium]